MTAAPEFSSSRHDGTAGSYRPDRVVLSRRQIEALSLLFEVDVTPVARAATRDIDCNDEHDFVDFQIDLHQRRVSRDGAAVHLTPREYDLLALARRDGAPVSSDDLVREVWRRHLEPGSRTLAQHIFTLRRKLERNPADPRFIRTVMKFGYRLEGGAKPIWTRISRSSGR